MMRKILFKLWSPVCFLPRVCLTVWAFLIHCTLHRYESQDKFITLHWRCCLQRLVLRKISEQLFSKCMYIHKNIGLIDHLQSWLRVWKSWMENPMTMFHKDAQRSCLFESTSWFVQLGPRGKSDWSKFWAQEFIKGNKGRQCIKNSTASDLTSVLCSIY